MRQVFEAAVQRYPKDARMHLYLGESCIELGNKTQAVAYLETAEKLATSNDSRDLSATERDQVKVAIQDAFKRVGGKKPGS
jgi:hypothetical protein